MFCQTLDWSEFSNISKLREIIDRHKCTDDTCQHRCELTNMATILLFPRGAVQKQHFSFVLTICIHLGEGLFMMIIYIRIVLPNRCTALTGDRLLLSFTKEKKQHTLRRIQNNHKGTPPDSVYHKHSVCSCYGEADTQLSLIIPTTTFSNKKRNLHQTFLVSFYQKQYNSPTRVPTIVCEGCLPIVGMLIAFHILSSIVFKVQNRSPV